MHQQEQQASDHTQYSGHKEEPAKLEKKQGRVIGIWINDDVADTLPARSAAVVRRCPCSPASCVEAVHPPKL